MDAAVVVLQKTGIMFLVMLAGWWAYRRGWMAAEVTQGISRFVVDLAFPCLVFTQMLRTVSVSALQQGWWIPLFAGVVILGSAWVGRLWARMARVSPVTRRTFVFLVAVPNWVFLPLLIADGLYGAGGVQVVLLFNMGAQIVLWTEGMRMLHGRPIGRDAVRGLLGNVGLMATLAGILVALLWPGAAALGEPVHASGWRLAGSTAIGALQMVGDLTVPLSLLTTGAQLGAARAATAGVGGRTLAGVLMSRLIAAPLIIMGLVWGTARLMGYPLTEVVFITLTVIVAMPVAVSCSMFVERFGGDRALTANGIFGTTLASLATVPAIVLLAHLLV